MDATVSSSQIPSVFTRPSVSPVDPVWDDAFSRVESYLRAHRVESRELLNRLAADIIREARLAAYDAASPADPVALAMRVTHERIGAWFAHAWNKGTWAHERDRAQGRLALVMADLPGRWSNHFLSTEAIPSELVTGMAGFSLQAGPELRFSNMPPAPLEFGPDETDPHRQDKSRWVLARAALSWVMIVGLVSAATAASLWSLR